MRLLLLVCFTLSLNFGNAQTQSSVDNNAILPEYFKKAELNGGRQFGFWLPTFFWEQIGRSLQIAPNEINSYSKVLEQYVIFCIADLSPSANGGYSYATQEDILQTLVLIDSGGATRKPLPPDRINPKVQSAIDQLQPFIKKAVGQVGDGMHFYLFPSKQKNGIPELNIVQKNNFTISWNKNSFTWQLPFNSAMPSLYCPVDHAEMRADWKYCPYHGIKLN